MEDGAHGQRVLLSDVSTEAVQAFLRYLYTADTSLSPRLVPDLTSLALRYGAPPLYSSLRDWQNFESCSCKFLKGLIYLFERETGIFCLLSDFPDGCNGQARAKQVYVAIMRGPAPASAA